MSGNNNDKIKSDRYPNLDSKSGTTILKGKVYTMKINKVSLIGLGAMGSFFAPKLDWYLGKENFRVIAGGERAKRLKSKGITVNGIPYHFTIIDPQSQNSPSDLIIMAVKDAGLAQAISDIRNQVGANTKILCVMNGIDSEEQVAEAYGWNHVLYSYMRVSIVTKDGVADYNPDIGSVHFGEAKNDRLSERVKSIKELFDACDIKSNIDQDMIYGMWFKFMCNIGENLSCAMFDIPFGAFKVSEHANAIRHGAMLEVIEIANRLGVGLGQKDIDRQEETIKNLPFFNKPSTLQDLENGKKTEIEMFAGKILKLGKELGIATPINWILYHGVKIKEEKNADKFKIEQA
jgi:2-dehydropantoate 2-reductase